MVVAVKIFKPYTIRLRAMCNLIFFVVAFSACRERETEVKIVWDYALAKGVSIPECLTKVRTDSLRHHLKVKRAGDVSATAIWGDYHREEGVIIFEPLFSFTRGLTYEIFVEGKRK